MPLCGSLYPGNKIDELAGGKPALIFRERILDSRVEGGVPRLAAAPINYLMAIRSFRAVARLWLAAL
jgi:hypothetical protein